MALSRFGVMFFEDPRAAFANIAAALRPGGRLAFVCWQEPRKVDYFSLPVRAAAANVGRPERPAPGDPGPFSLADPERIRALLTGAGFGDVEIADLSVRSWFGRDADDVLGYYRGMPMVRSLLAEADDRSTERVFQTLRDALLERQSEDGVHVAASAWLATAVR